MSSPLFPLSLPDLSLEPVLSDQHLKQVLDRLIEMYSKRSECDRVIDILKDQLTAALDNGDIDPSFLYEDWGFAYREGRNVVVLSEEAKQQITTIKEDDIASGRATCKRSASSWAIKAPSL